MGFLRRPVLALFFGASLLGTELSALDPQGPDGSRSGPPSGPPPGARTGNRLLFMTPPGKWWNDTSIAGRLGLSVDQQKRIENLFQQNRLRLIDLTAALDRENAVIDPILAADPVDDEKVFSQIDRIAQARADLEKANGRFLVGIRKVLTADQWRKLQSEKPSLPPPNRRNLE